MAYVTHSSRAAFFWNSSLSDERKDEIIEWLKTLAEPEQKMVEDLLNDVYDEATFDATEDENI